MPQKGQITTDNKCPKCKSTSFIAVEIWEDAAIYFTVKNSVLDRYNGMLEPGNPHKVQGRCDCGHVWTFKKANQIDDITNQSI